MGAVALSLNQDEKEASSIGPSYYLMSLQTFVHCKNEMIAFAYSFCLMLLGSEERRRYLCWAKPYSLVLKQLQFGLR